jgi:hypothetical protein
MLNPRRQAGDSAANRGCGLSYASPV